MLNRRIFVDTNILVYAHDRDAENKYQMAKNKVTDLWNSSMSPAISVQVLQELYVNLRKKKVSADDAQQTIQDYFAWDVIENDTELLIKGIELQKRWQSSFWDALILAAAKRAQAQVIWSEDFNTNQIYDGILVVNPFF